MRIKTLTVRNYKLFKELHFDGLDELPIVTGESGSGKSTLCEIFYFLKNGMRRGLTEVIGDFVSNGTNTISSAVDKTSGVNPEIEFELTGFDEITVKKNIHPIAFRYFFKVREENWKMFVLDERLSLTDSVTGETHDLISTQCGELSAFLNPVSYSKAKDGTPKFTKLKNSMSRQDVLTLSVLSDYKSDLMPVLKRFLCNTCVYRKNINLFSGTAYKSDAQVEDDGSNYLSCLFRLQNDNNEKFSSIVDEIKSCFQDIDNISVEQTSDGFLLLRCERQNKSLPAYNAEEEGLVRMLSLLTLLHQDAPYSLLILDRPEEGLSARCRAAVEKNIAAYADAGNQICVVTNSESMLERLRAANEKTRAFCLEKTDGFSVLKELFGEEINNDPPIR